MRKFGRKRGPRRLFLKVLAHNLILREKMETTEARAKELRPIVERLVTIAKGQQVSALRQLLSKLPKASASKLYYELAPRFQDRKGGYLRIIKTALRRKRDGSAQAKIEFVS